MQAQDITPILNVSDLQQSFDWFDRLGWTKRWDWGEPPTFGAVYSGKCDIFLCQNGQGGRGKGTNSSTFAEPGGETADKGVWMSIWVDNVDEVHRECLAHDVEVMLEPEDMPWGAREMHIRHPDGHVFRVSQGIASE